MIEFFQKKRFLVDYLGGLVDIHNHILPGIDDGAKNIEESLGLIEAFGEIGITRFIATPHIMHGMYPNTPETIAAAHDELVSALMARDMKDIRVERAAEHMIDQRFSEIMVEGGFVPLHQSYMLVETSYLQKPFNFKEAILNIASRRMQPILAHPERYPYFSSKSKTYERYRAQGIRFQCNLLSFGGYYGTNIQKKALEMLEDETVDFVGSDVHNLKHLRALKQIQLPEKIIQKLIPVISRTVETFY
ncbi:tyrosine-protein phosphatase [Robiginitalea sp. IMCC43444]|uniref:tyrosine-protein phosphatase n=1 Tax=Robiginitalea sp. IMCC43444 TaxID=3459121 RepID=UPI0040415120